MLGPQPTEHWLCIFNSQGLSAWQAVNEAWHLVSPLLAKCVSLLYYVVRACSCNVIAMASQPNSDGLQPRSDGLQPKLQWNTLLKLCSLSITKLQEGVVVAVSVSVGVCPFETRPKASASGQRQMDVWGPTSSPCREAEARPKGGRYLVAR